jgi:lipopolysaccharide transport protein LptA
LHAGQGAAADLLQLADDSTIVVSADESWEDIDQGTLHFRGHFEIRTPQWQLTADQATIYGKLEDPQRIVAEGADDGTLVYFIYHGSDSNPSATTEGEGQHLEYKKAHSLLTLSGHAKLTNGDQIMRSSTIQYDLKQEQLNAGGDEGVQVIFIPDQDED